MIAPRKIIYMTRAAKCEKGDGKTSLKISEYSRLDYLLIQLLRSVFLGSIAFGGICMLWVCANWESLNTIFFDADYMGFISHVLTMYGVFMAVYLVIVGIVSLVRYQRCLKKRNHFLALLKRIH